jgi:glycosyltransferase involved in cell wall biosynthesis
VIDKHFATYAKNRYGAEERDLVNIPIGVDTKDFRLDTFTTVSKRKVIASIGHVIPIRNRVTLIRAFKEYLELFPNVVLLIVGGVYEKSLYREISSLGLSENIVITGALPRKQIIEILRQSLMEIHDVQEHEGRGLGIASLEAMLMGVPIISSTPIDYFPNAVLTPDRELLLVRGDNERDLFEQMIRLTRDKALWTQLSENGRKWVLKNFSLEQVANAHEDLYKQLTVAR